MTKRKKVNTKNDFARHPPPPPFKGGSGHLASPHISP
jgi:hypothetical protein